MAERSTATDLHYGPNRRKALFYSGSRWIFKKIKKLKSNGVVDNGKTEKAGASLLFFLITITYRSCALWFPSPQPP